jgi:hypothetical protein
VASCEVSLSRSSVVGRAWKYAAMIVKTKVSASKLKLKVQAHRYPFETAAEPAGPNHSDRAGSPEATVAVVELRFLTAVPKSP